MPTPATYATINELTIFWRPMTAAEQTRATQLLNVASAEIRLKAISVGKDFDEMLQNNSDLALLTKSIVCKVVGECMNKDVEQLPFSQFSESAGGYSLSGTYYSASIGTFFTKNDWHRLGLRVQRYGGLNPYVTD